MSSSSSFFIFLFCLSVHLCSARNFGVLFHKDSAPEIPFQGKGSAEEGKTDGDSIVGKSHGGATTTQQAEQPEAAVGEGGVPRMKSVVWISWSVPKKIHDENAEFFSDYARPRTRPPSNN